MRRAHLVRQRTRIKNQVHAILARNLVPTLPAADLFGKRAGTGFPSKSSRSTSGPRRPRCCASWTSTARSCDRRQGLAVALAEPAVARLMTIPGVDAIAGDLDRGRGRRFHPLRDPDKLVAYVGLNPRVRQSGNSAPVTAGSARPAARTCAAYWSKRRGQRRGRPGRCARSTSVSRLDAESQKAVVATARKMTVLCWHLVTKDQDYAFARPALVTHKRRKLELAAGAPSRRGSNGRRPVLPTRPSDAAERELAVEQAEHAYEVLVAHWQPKRPTPA